MQADWPAHGTTPVLLSVQLHHAGMGIPGRARRGGGSCGRPVVSVSGDGGFVMTAQDSRPQSDIGCERSPSSTTTRPTARSRTSRQRVHEARYLDVELNNPDFLQLASAFGVPSRRAGGPEEFRSALRKALDRDGPSVIEVPDQWRFLRDLATPFR